MRWLPLESKMFTSHPTRRSVSFVRGWMMAGKYGVPAEAAPARFTAGKRDAVARV